MSKVRHFPLHIKGILEKESEETYPEASGWAAHQKSDIIRTHGAYFCNVTHTWAHFQWMTCKHRVVGFRPTPVPQQV